MRYITYIIIAFLSVFCFNQAIGQGVSNFGASRAQDTSKTKGQIVATAYATNVPNLYLKATSTGHLILDTVSNGTTYFEGYGIQISGDTINLDTALLNGVYLKFSDSVVSYVTPSQFGLVIIQLTNLIDMKLDIDDSVTGYATQYDLAQAVLNQLEWSDTNTYIATKADIENIPAPTAPTWQQTLNQGRTGDSVLVTDNLYIQTIADKKPVSFQLWGDSWGIPTYIDTKYGWAQNLCSILGWTLINKSGAGCFLMSQTPLNPFGCSPNLIDALSSIKNVTGLTDSIYMFCIDRGFNDASYFYNNGGTNYNVTNYGIAYRRVLDTLIAKGYQLSNILIKTPHWIPRTSIPTEINNLSTYNDTTKVVGAQYGVTVFDAFSWMRDNSNSLEYLPDEVHPNSSGYGTLLQGVLKKVLFSVTREDQALASNGLVDLRYVKVRPTADTIKNNVVNLLGVNTDGTVVLSTNDFLRTYPNITDTGQGSNINITGQSNVRDTRQRNGLFFGTGNSVTDGLSTFNSITGQAIRIDRQNINSQVCSTATATTLALQSNSGNLFIGKGATSDNNTGAKVQMSGYADVDGGFSISGSGSFTNKNGILMSFQSNMGFIDARSNSTATARNLVLNNSGDDVLLGGTTDAGTFKLQVKGSQHTTGTLNVNDNFQLSNAGVITEYRNVTPRSFMMLMGTGTALDTTIATAGTGISLTNTGGVFTIRTDSTTIGQNLWYTDPTSITSNQTRTVTKLFNQFYVDASSGNVTLTITPSYVNQTINVTREDNTANTVTLIVTGRTINGNPSFTGLVSQYSNAPIFIKSATEARIQ